MSDGWAFPSRRYGLPSTKDGAKEVGPDGRVTQNREDTTMSPNCKNCDDGQHSACNQRGLLHQVVCNCECTWATQARKMLRVTPPGLDDLPDKTVGFEDLTPTAVTDAITDAITTAHVEFDSSGKTAIKVPIEVLRALTSRAKKWDDREILDAQPAYIDEAIEGFRVDIGGVWEKGQATATIPVDWLLTASETLHRLGPLAEEAALLRRHNKTIAAGPIIIHGDGADIEKITKQVIDRQTAIKTEGAKENGDPFYQRAKKALAEIGTFEKVEVRHETDIVTTRNANGETVAVHRSGLERLVIEIEGYTR